MCVLFCVQEIGEWQRKLQDPSTDERGRSYLEEWVKSSKSLIQQDNADISSIDGELAELVGERPAILNQGEPPGCHADDCRAWLPWQHVTTVTMDFPVLCSGCHGSVVAMTTKSHFLFFFSFFFQVQPYNRNRTSCLVHVIEAVRKLKLLTE